MMKKKQIAELHNKSKKELISLIQQIEHELVQLRLHLQTGKLKSSHEWLAKKRDLARIKTILKEKELNINETV